MWKDKQVGAFKHNFILAVFLLFSHSLFAQQNVNADSLRKVIATSKDNATVIMAMIMMGDKTFYSHPDSALKLFDKAEKMAQRLIDAPSTSDAMNKQLQKYLAFSYLDRGLIYDQKGDPIKALNYYNQALNIYEQTDRKYGIAGVLNSIGRIYQNGLNDVTRALDCYSRALNLYNELDDTINSAVILSNIGSVYKMKGNNTLARQYYARSLKINERINNMHGIADVSRNMAELYKDDGHIPEAVTAANRSLKLYNETGDMEGVSASMVLLADIYFVQRNFVKAKDIASQALHIAEQNNYRKNIKEAAFILQKIYKEQDKYQEALGMGNLYNRMRDTIENKDVQAQVIRDLVYFENRNKALMDSLKFVTFQQEKDSKIKQQQILIESQRKLRNAFVVIGLFVLIGGLLLFNRYRLSQRLKRNEMVVSALEDQQKLLWAQMNPHFINNALNSIQSLILENETMQAGEYLATFSRLTRAILEQTRKKFIPLSKEVETLNMYLEMEKLRFEDKFDYEIILPESISGENLYIPPLLIQPFVENSILHGISHKEGKGKITVEFVQHNNTLTTTVTDDGVGREKSKEINSHKTSRGGNAIAMELAQHRLALINLNGNKTIHITDLVDKNGNGCGTKVVLNIPLTFKHDKSSIS